MKKAGHDLKFDAIVLAQHGVTLRGFDIDTMLASYLIDATRSEHKLEDLALEHTSYKALTEEDICGRGTKAMSLAELPVEAAVDYACERADLAGQLAPIFCEQLAKDELTAVYETLERPLIPVLVAVERAGIRIDGRALAAQSHKIEQDLALRTASIYAAAGGEFNINSPKQLAEILFDKLQLPVLKRTGTSRAPSTAVEVLEELALAHELPRQILEWRGAHEAERHLHRRAAAARASRDRPGAHLLQPGGRRDRTPEQQRSEPAEHPDQDRARPRNPAARSSPIPATC